MMQILNEYTPVYSLYSKYTTSFNKGNAKQKVTQIVAIIALLNGVYHTAQKRLIQAVINTAAGAVLWLNQEAFLYKALSEDVTSFSVENDRLCSLLNEFEQIGIDLKTLTEARKEELKKQIKQFQGLFETYTGTVEEIGRSFEASAKKLRDSIALSSRNLIQAQNTLTLVFEQFVVSFKRVGSQEDLSYLKMEVQTLNELAQSVLQETQIDYE